MVCYLLHLRLWYKVVYWYSYIHSEPYIFFSLSRGAISDFLCFICLTVWNRKSQRIGTYTLLYFLAFSGFRCYPLRLHLNSNLMQQRPLNVPYRYHLFCSFYIGIPQELIIIFDFLYHTNGTFLPHLVCRRRICGVCIQWFPFGQRLEGSANLFFRCLLDNQIQDKSTFWHCSVFFSN